MKLALQTFTSLVQGMAATTQSASRQVLDLTVGSTLRAILEANASVGLWMQWLILQVLQLTRAATSSGVDLDSWMADFSLTRLPAMFATGTVTFSRLAPTIPALIPPGTLVRTTDAAMTFAVTTDQTNPLWSAAQAGYALPAGTVSIDLPVVAQVAGASGNVQANMVSMLASAVPGVDVVINTMPFVNGMEPESDAALRARFQGFLGSLSRATRSAVGYAIISIQQGLIYTITENIDGSGAVRMGSFVVIVDDGSGSPSPVLLSDVYAAIDAVRPLGSTFFVRAPDIIHMTLSMTVSLATDADRNAVVAQIVSAVTDYVDSLPIGAILPITRIAQIVYDTHPAVTSVGQVLLNGAAVDLIASASEVIKTTGVVVN